MKTLLPVDKMEEKKRLKRCKVSEVLQKDDDQPRYDLSRQKMQKIKQKLIEFDKYA